MATIFPCLPTDIENRIVYYMGERPQALVDLSGTSIHAATTLSNSFFEQLFAAKHPLLAKTNAVFLQLKTYYPNCCWKVACCTMAKGYTPFSKEFLERALPSMVLHLDEQRSEMQAKKHEAECGLQYICRSHYADPNSPIHQAWEAKVSAEVRYSELKASFRTCESNNDEYMNSLKDEERARLGQERSQIELEICKLLEPFSHDEKHIARFEKHGDMPPGLLLGQKRDGIVLYLLRLFGEYPPSYWSRDISEIQDDLHFRLLDIALVKEYQKACLPVMELKKKYEKLQVSPEAAKIKQELLEAHGKMRSSSAKYQELDGARLNHSFELKNHPREMIAINKKLDCPIDFNRLCLMNDLYFAKHHEIITFSIDWLGHRCEDMSVNSELLKSRFVESKGGQIILEMLYHQCANGVIEDRWAETHFHEFRDELVDIVSGLKKLSHYIEGIYGKNIDLSIKCYLDKNIEAIREGLPFLKEMRNSLKEKIPADGQPMLLEDTTYFVDQFKKIDPFFRILLHAQSRYARFNNVDVRVKMLPFLNLLINHIENYEA